MNKNYGLRDEKRGLSHSPIFLELLLSPRAILTIPLSVRVPFIMVRIALFAGTRKDYLIKEEKEEGGGAAGVSSVSHKGGVGRGAGKGKTKPGECGLDELEGWV